MVQPISIKIEGIPQLKKHINKKMNLITSKANEAIKESGFFIQGEVKQSIAGHRAETRSVDTGRFLNSIGVDLKMLQAIIFSNVRYAKHLEFGTSRITPRRHFKNTSVRNKSKVAKFVQSKVDKI